MKKKRGISGWPRDLTFKATEGADLVEVTIRDAGSAKDGVWKRIDPWGFAFFHKVEELTKKALSEKPLRLTFSLRSPDTLLAKCQYEALKRRVSYLAEANHLQIALLKADNNVKLYSIKELTDRPDTEVVRSDFSDHGDDDTPGRLEKDFQAYLFGKGLHDPSDPDISRTNERLAIFGEHFVRIGKTKSGRKRSKYEVVREFPTGAFDREVKESTRILSTEFVDLVTLNSK